MKLTPALHKAYTEERLSAREAQRLAEFIAFGPVVFQVARLMLRYGILDHLREADSGLTEAEVAAEAGLSDYAARILLESSLTAGIVLIDEATERYRLSKVGWCLVTDPLTRVNIDFNHDVNYEGLFHLDEALRKGYPAGLRKFGPWQTIYEGLSQLPAEVQKSWLAFDHFYSDNAFDEALRIVFARTPRRLLDVGGNTGRWALRCVEFDEAVEVTVMDMPGQLEMMRRNVDGRPGAERIRGYGANLLDTETAFPAIPAFDAIWMSQFLDCFDEEDILSILSRAARSMAPDSRLYIMETLWDRQRYEPAAFCLTQISVYFTALANGNSKMYRSDAFCSLIRRAGLEVEAIHDNLGHGHSLIVCRRGEA